MTFDKRQGDLALTNTLDGGEITVLNGEPVMDQGFGTAVFLSIAGPSDWWANEYLRLSQRLIGQLQNFIRGNTLTSGNLRTAEEFGKQDLQWMIDDGIAQEIDLTIRAISRNKIEFLWWITTPLGTVEQNKFLLNWQAQRDYPVSERI